MSFFANKFLISKTILMVSGGKKLAEKKIAIIGGTGHHGSGLVLRLAKSNKKVIIGSRSAEKGKRIAADLRYKIQTELIEGTDNLTAAKRANIIFLSVPYEALGNILQSIKPGLKDGDILVDMIVPLSFEKGHPIINKAERSVGEQIKKIVSEISSEIEVVSGLKTIGSKKLADITQPLDCDVFICGDDETAKEEVAKLLTKIEGGRIFDAGPLSNSEHLELLAALAITINKIYGISDACFKVVGI